MTWTKNLENKINTKFGISARVHENFKSRYKRYHHRAAFKFVRQHNDSMKDFFLDRHDWEQAHELTVCLTKALGDAVRVRNEWYETFVYFENLENFLSAVTEKQMKSLLYIDAMSDINIRAKDNYESDFRINLSVVRQLPYKKYRYRIWLVTSSKQRHNIGLQNITQMCDTINAYDGIRQTSAFERIKQGRYYCDNLYFYSETLDFLPMIALMDSRFIKHIEHFKTSEEIKNETTT